ncbi:hypothetical protein ML462_02845 [Gramella lutea]|uniref:Uncharacterized protein n=1 Tax=Christiangramia lutea TaxID=1607951 RepID=A0A9X1V3D9_9FLAO|nr:hypothetical protein [Christiangramia lutea]MCH4822098.1 hypothetical protein [Christiangramia lutea]
MKIFRSTLLLCSFFISFSFFGQANDSIPNLKSKTFSLYNTSSRSMDQPVTLKKLDIEPETPTLVLYNNSTNLYDIYFNVNDAYSYGGSNTIFETNSNFFTTLFLGNDSFTESNTLLPNTSLLLDQDVRYIARDSFNPNGASNFYEAVLGGVLGLLFD